MKFTKMQGAGNDFIIINNMDGKIDRAAYSDLAARLCPRHMAVGADGMMFVEPAEQDGDFKMMFYNADGMQGEMCGNALRSVGKYVYDHALTDKTDLVIETLGGMQNAAGPTSASPAAFIFVIFSGRDYISLLPISVRICI